MKQPPIYLDYNATTPPDPSVRSQVNSWLDQWGNPSSIHGFGRGPKRILRESRRSLAKDLGVHPLELIFTSCGSEANNLAIQGLLSALGDSPRKKILVSAIEHPSIRNTFLAMGGRGYEVITVPVDLQGSVDMGFYEQHLDDKVALVSAMVANNEVGVCLPVKTMVDKAKGVGAYFHADCVQALGKMDLDLKDLGVDFATFSSHKLYALKGAGILYVKKGTPLEPTVFGGSQERGRRAGTENLLAIASMAFMVPQLIQDNRSSQMKALRDQMETRICEEISGVHIVAGNHPLRLPNTSCVTIDNVDGEALMMNLDIRGFAVSTGAACSSGNPEPSPVLLAMGLTRKQAQSSLRVSLGRPTSEDEINCFVAGLVEVVAHLRSLAGHNGEVQYV